jgi:glutamyl-tRNA synthetase
LLGWTAGDDKEYYDMDELIQSFSLERVNNSGAIFDMDRLNWLNAEHLRKKSDEEILKMLRDELKDSKYSSLEFSDEYLISVIKVMRERVSFIKEIYEKGFYFFEEPETYEEASVKKGWKEQSPEILKKYAEKISSIENPTRDDFEKVLNDVATEMNIGKGTVIHPLRLAVSGVSGGPGINDIVYIIGKEKTIKRIFKIINKLS